MENLSTSFGTKINYLYSDLFYSTPPPCMAHRSCDGFIFSISASPIGAFIKTLLTISATFREAVLLITKIITVKIICKRFFKFNVGFRCLGLNWLYQ